MEEIWKPVFGYEGYYEVSNYGNVKAVNRVIKKSNGVIQSRSERQMSIALNDDGYPTVKLSKDGRSERAFVHRLVALAFVPNPLGLPEVNHIDFDRQNAMADNLEWVSHKDNVDYTIKAGRHYCNRDLKGVNNPNYNGTTLKEFYSCYPEEKQKLARKGSQNGMARPVEVILPDGSVRRFGYLRECSEYLIQFGICSCKNKDTVADRISSAIKRNTTYCDCHFSRV